MKNSLLLFVAACVLAAGLTACGGSGSVGGGPSPTPTPVQTPSPTPTPTPAPSGVSVSPSLTTINVGTTQQFTATVTPTGASQSVLWFVNGVQGGAASTGTISASGLYTAPATLAAQTNFSITAKAAADATKVSSAATVTVNPPPPPPARTLALNAGQWKVEFDGQGSSLAVKGMATGHKAGDILQLDPLLPANSFLFSGVGDVNFELDFLTDQTVGPRKERMRFCDPTATNCSNWVNFVLVGSGQNALIVTASGTVAYRDQGTAFIHEYSAPAGAGPLTESKNFQGAGFGSALAFDESQQVFAVTAMPVVNQTLASLTTFDLAGTRIGGSLGAGDAMGVATRGGKCIYAQPTLGVAQTLTLGPVPANPISAPTGGTPWAAARATIGAEEDGLVLLRGNATTQVHVQKYNLANMVRGGDLTLPVTGGGSPQLVAFGPTAANGAANKAAARVGSTLFIIDAATMTVDHTVNLPNGPLSGAVQIFADEVHGVVIVSSYNATTDTSNLEDVDVATGTVGASYGTTGTYLYGLALSAGSPFVIGGNVTSTVNDVQAISFQ